jgi:D-alanyl-D-alanine carboxypeptidase
MTDFCMLVNKKYPLPSNYVPTNLVDSSSPNLDFILDPNEKILIVEDVLIAFNQLKEAGLKDGHHIEIESGYRSYHYQEKLRKHYIATKGEEWTRKYVALPGTSEHQTGLAIDFLLVRNSKLIEEMNDDDKEVHWVHQNAHLYGFIIRYPKNKERITGYSYEPWHLRYVTKKTAIFLKENNITLEEYFQNKKDN